ncbi:MAG: hypothetical protein Q8L14_37155 [Myxococcales bacterium]|nr:hypothetical protein [Myxococcales bacterium]
MLALLSVACGPVEIRISKAQGVKPVTGSLVATFDTSAGRDFVCGDSIIGDTSAQSFTVTSKAVNGGCEFNFDQEVEVLAGADYATIKEFTNSVRYLNRVDLEIRKLDFYDGEGTRFDVENRIRDVEFWVNGQQVLNIDQVRSLPTTIVLKGEALDVMKRAVKNRERCTAHIVSKVVVLDAMIKKGIRCDYDSQPTFILSSSEI